MNLLITTFATLFSGTIYQCEQNNTIIYSQHSCAENAIRIEEESLGGPIGAGINQDDIAAIDEKVSRTLERQRINLEMDRIRTRSARRIDGFARTRNDCIRRLPRAANNLAGAVYQKSLRECQASYDSLIAREQQATDLRLDELRRQRASVSLEIGSRQ